MKARLPRRPSGRLVAVSIAAVIGLVVSLGVTVHMLSDEKPDAYAYFVDASPLIKGNDVKASGVKVGTIGSIEVVDGVAKVGLVLDDAVLPLHQDATARVRPVGLLGERYVELDRGSVDTSLLTTGGSIPVTQTSRATDLDEVLNMVDEPTGAGLSLLVTTLGEGIMGRGEKADLAIRALAPALQNTDRLAAILDDQNSVLQNLIDSVSPVASQLATERGQQLDALLDAADTTLQATARNDSQLDDTLHQLPSTLGETSSTLASLTRTARSTTPVLAAMRPTTDNLVQLSKELDAFARTARPALDGLDPVLDQATVLLDRARPVTRSLGALSPDMLATAESGRKIATYALDNLTTVLDFVKYWAMTTTGQDGLSHYFRAHLVVTTDIASGLVPGGPDIVPELPTIPVPGLDGLLDDPLGGVPSLDDLLGGLGGKGGKAGNGGGVLGNLVGGLGGGGKHHRSKAASGGSATGLTSAQEESLMSYLIGGE
ncbi:hypothetical protein BH11ACT8_BH11ACT8_00550 [soil metagenome]